MSPDVLSPRPADRARTGARARRKSRRRGLFEPLEWALVRAPLLPVEAYLGGGEDEPSDSLLPRDRRVRGALAVGSQDLLGALERTRTGDPDAEPVRGKLLRYVIRMATRPTPYGLFAGVGLAHWGATTALALAPGPPRTRTRPDMAWLLDLVMALEREPEIRRRLRLFANPSVLIRAGRVFLTERAPTGTGAAPPVSLRATGAVQRALAAARTPIPYAELADELLSAAGATPEKVEGLIAELLQQTVLLTDLRPPLTVDSPARHVHERLVGIPAAHELAERLGVLLGALERWDQLALEDRAQAWSRLVDNARAIHPVPASTSPVQLDMALSLADRHVHGAVAAEAAQAGELLLRLSPYPRGLPHLEGYRRAFEARYGPEREVPLLELLDPEFGLGLPAEHGLGWGGLDQRRAALRQQTLRDLALEAYRERRLIVELDDELLDRLETWSPTAETAPLSLDVSIFVAAPSPAAVDAGDFRVVVGPNLGATAAGRNLGRFADLLGSEAHAALERVARAEALHTRGRIPAEVVYLPQRTRSANVAVRPVIREHEIVLGTIPGVPPDRVIPLDELVVGLRDDRFYVRWPAAGKEVAFFEGHMLNAFQAPPAARFLEDVGRDGRVQLSSFDWGPAAGFPLLPRVQRGRIVLTLAQWRIDPATRAGELPVEPPPAFHDAVPARRARWSVPRHVYLAVGDNRLLLDLEHPAHAEQLREELRGLPDGQSLVLQEALPGSEDAWLPGPGGRYMPELVVPVVLRPPAAVEPSEPAPAPVRDARAAPESSRLRAPGSDWLFLKLYCPRALEEELIVGPLRTIGEFASSAGLADAWFFVRYADPDPHLRVRFHGAPDALLGRLLPQLCSWARDLIADGLCPRFAFETYDREVERYGGEAGATVAETIFGADSPAVVELLALSRAHLPTIDRTTLAVVSIDDLLGGVGLSEDER
jgi:lantibiotic biosynthesis protein